MSHEGWLKAPGPWCRGTVCLGASHQGMWLASTHPRETLTKALLVSPVLFAPLLVIATVVPQEHALQLLALLLLPLPGQLGAGLLVLQHVLDVLPHLLKVAVLRRAAVRVC